MLKWILKKINNRKGFTLIELIVVIAILGILAAIAVPRFAGMTGDAGDKACAASRRAVESAVSIYEAEHGNLPDNITALVSGGYLAEEPKCPADSDDSYVLTETGKVTCPNHGETASGD